MAIDSPIPEPLVVHGLASEQIASSLLAATEAETRVVRSRQLPDDSGQPIPDSRHSDEVRVDEAEYLPRECAMHEDKSEPLRITELLNSDMWQDRVERNHAASPRLAELTRIQLANMATRWSGPEAHRVQLLATLDRVCG